MMGVVPLAMGWIQVDWSSLPASVWWGVLYAGVVSTFIAQGTFNFAMRLLPVTISSLALTFQSVFSAVLGSLLLGESFTIWRTAGVGTTCGDASRCS
jgi:drug/metabolite transporter (DMT)-like permease